MNRVRVQVAADGMTAEVTITAGAAGTAKELSEALKLAGVVAGLDDQLVQETAPRLLDATFQFRGIVARGEPVTAGQEGRIEPNFKVGLMAGQELTGGWIDYHERSLLHPAKTGDVVARHVFPVPGKPGRDVRGKVVVPPPPKDAVIKLGPGVKELAKGEITAQREGVVLFVKDKSLDVVPLYQHDGNVDLASGNLHTKGSLLVGGDVCATFSADADGDVIVKGTVLGKVRGSSVLIDQGVMGKDSAVTAKEDITCRHATNATLEAGGSLTVADQVVQCSCRAEVIDVARGRGRVVAGEMRSRGNITVIEAGSDAGPITLLAAADLTDQQADRVRKEVGEARMARMGQKHAGADGRKGGKFARAAVQIGDQAQQERLALAKRQRELLATATIEIRGIAHAGVRIQLGEARLDLQEPVANARFRWDPDRTRIVNLNEPEKKP